jgi:hypothetical protein
MNTVLAFTAPNIARQKADADQIDLLDMIVDSHALMSKAALLVSDDVVKSTPELRDLLGRAADWMRLFQQTVEMLEQEVGEA